VLLLLLFVRSLGASVFSNDASPASPAAAAVARYRNLSGVFNAKFRPATDAVLPPAKRRPN
jgi:hypothetical protein